MKEYKYIVVSNCATLNEVEDYLGGRNSKPSNSYSYVTINDYVSGTSGYTSYIRAFETVDEAEKWAKEQAAKGYRCYVAKLDSYVTKATPPIEVTKYS